MAITAQQVKELREMTGAGMMECKKALTETNGDLDAAVELMRKTGQAKAAKKAGRIAAEGLVVTMVSEDGKGAAIVEVNCETDFVAREDAFVAFANDVARLTLASRLNDVEALQIASLKGQTVETVREALIAKIGENIKVRRVQFIETDGVIGDYIHGGRIAVLVSVKNADADLARDIAMHIAASKPEVIKPEDVTQETIAKEKEIFSAQALESGKSEEIVEKMVAGRIKKFLNEVSLLGQPYVKDPNQTVQQLLQSKQAEVTQFVRFEVGEGIEKKQENFAEEVKAQVKGV